MPGVPHVVVVEERHQVAAGMSQAAVPGLGGATRFWRTTRIRSSTLTSSASAPGSGEPSSTTITSQLVQSWAMTEASASARNGGRLI